MNHEVVIAQPPSPKEMHNDTRSYVDRMFMDFNPETGKTTVLPVRAQNGANINKLADVIVEPNTIPVILNYGKNVADFTEMNGLKQGEHLLMIGGQRQGKASLGSLRIPFSEVDSFIDALTSLKNAVKDQLPDLMSKMEN